jgi:hypothetical protein
MMCYEEQGRSEEEFVPNGLRETTGVMSGVAAGGWQEGKDGAQCQEGGIDPNQSPACI